MYTYEGLMAKMAQGGFGIIEGAAEESKYYSGDPAMINQAIAQAALPFLSTADEAVAFAKKFMSLDGQHTAIREYASHRQIFVTDIPVLVGAVDYRADVEFGGPAMQTGVAVFQAAAWDLDRIETLSQADVLAISKHVSYDIPKAERLVFGEAIGVALIKFCSCVQDVLAIREQLPTTLEKNEILAGYALEKNPGLPDILELYDNVRMSEPVLAEVTQATLLDLGVKAAMNEDDYPVLWKLQKRVEDFAKRSVLPMAKAIYEQLFQVLNPEEGAMAA
jgi:hypothetical protein